MTSHSIRGILGLALFIWLAVSLYSWHKEVVEQARQTIITEVDTEYVRDIEAQLVVSRQLYVDLQHDSAKREEKLARDNVALQRINDGLRKRPARPTQEGSSSSNPPTPSTEGTGTSLYREDGEFLAGEAATASRIADQRDQCYAAYGRASEQLKELNVKN